MWKICSVDSGGRESEVATARRPPRFCSVAEKRRPTEEVKEVSSADEPLEAAPSGRHRRDAPEAGADERRMTLARGECGQARVSLRHDDPSESVLPVLESVHERARDGRPAIGRAPEQRGRGASACRTGRPVAASGRRPPRASCESRRCRARRAPPHRGSVQPGRSRARPERRAAPRSAPSPRRRREWELAVSAPASVATSRNRAASSPGPAATAVPPRQTKQESDQGGGGEPHEVLHRLQLVRTEVRHASPRMPGDGHDRGSRLAERDAGVARGAVRPHARAAGRALLDDLRARERAAGDAGHGRARLRPRPRLSRRVPVHARRLSVDVPRPALDDAAVRGLRHGGGDERALPLPARPRPDGALDRVRHADADGLRLRPRALARRGRPGGRRDRLARGHADAVPRDPARRGLDVDDDQLAGGDPARVLRRRRRGAGRAGGGAARDDPDGHPQGVHRAEGVHLPARAVDAARHGHGRVLRDGDAAVAPDLDLRLPHPRGRLDGGAGARVHARGRLHLRRVGARARAGRRRVRAAALLLLQRASRLLRGDREVPRGAADLGARAARPLRRAQPALAG